MGEKQLVDDKIQWHNGFLSGIQLEFHNNASDLSFHDNETLNKDSLEIDMLIIKKNAEVVLSSELGKYFKQYNIVEYKSNSDNLNIDTVYKVVGYGCLYKSYGNVVNERKATDITITMMRQAKPIKLFSLIERNGGRVENIYPGLYRLLPDFLFPTYAVVTKELDFQKHIWLAAIKSGLTKDEIKFILKDARKYTIEGDKRLVDDVLSIVTRANTSIIARIKEEDEDMCKELFEIMKPEIDAYTNNAVDEKLISKAKKAISEKGWSVDEAMEFFDIKSSMRGNLIPSA